MDPQLPPERWETRWRGLSRALLERLSTEQRQRAVVVTSFLAGVVACAGALWWWNDLSPEQVREPSTPTATAGAEVRLVLSGVVAPARPGDPGGRSSDGPLRIDGVLLHSRQGEGTATVTRIHRPGGSIAIRVPALPVRLSVNHSFVRVGMQITPRDCELATQWTPSAQPLLLTWQDDHGDVHVDVGGDHDAAMEISLIRYLDEACDDRGVR